MYVCIYRDKVAISEILGHMGLYLRYRDMFYKKPGFCLGKTESDLYGVFCLLKTLLPNILHTSVLQDTWLDMGTFLERIKTQGCVYIYIHNTFLDLMNNFIKL